MIAIRIITDAQDARKFLEREEKELEVFRKRQTIVIVKADDLEAASVFAGYDGWLVGNAFPNTTIPGKHFLVKRRK